jgi:hypothetical protein
MKRGAEKTIAPAGVHRKAISYPGAFAPAILFAPFQGVTILKCTDRRYQQSILLSDRWDG